MKDRPSIQQCSFPGGHTVFWLQDCVKDRPSIQQCSFPGGHTVFWLQHCVKDRPSIMLKGNKVGNLLRS